MIQLLTWSSDQVFIELLSVSPVCIYMFRFVADGEIGSKAVTELLYFNVSDASRNLLPSQVMSVLILPVNNQPPVVTVAHDLEVSYSGIYQDHLSNRFGDI